MSRIVLVAAVALAGFIGMLVSIDTPTQRAIQQGLVIEFAQRSAGFAMTLLGGLGMVWQWRSPGPLSRFSSSGLLMLSGVVVGSGSWGAGLAVAAILIASRFPSPADTAAPSDRSRSLDDPAPNWLNQ